MKYNYEKVQEAFNNGETATSACKRLGIPAGSYYTWRSQSKRRQACVKRTTKANVTTFTMPTQDARIMVFYGPANEIMNAVRSLQ